VRESIQQIRDVILALGSPSMKEIGLAAALSEWAEDQVEKRYGLRTSFTDTSGKLLLSYDIQAMLFRNTRELVMNAAKHAQVDSVSVKMESSGRVFRITVEDKGIGFEPASAGNLPDHSRGFGLFSIEERMTDLGGSLEMVAAPGKGCKATLVMPLGLAEERGSQ
jgi:signal transduction histidine kinase